MESGLEGVYFVQGQGIDFGLQLIRYCKVSWFFEEVFFEVYFVFFCLWWIVDVQVGYLEYFVGVFCIVFCDDGGVYVEIVIIIVIFMDGIGNIMMDVEYCIESIGVYVEVCFFV